MEEGVPYHDYGSPRRAGGAVEMAGGDQRSAALRAEIARLDEDERALLRHVGSADERRDVTEQFFHQRMNLIAQLPPAERDAMMKARGGGGGGGGAGPRQVMRMGTLRNVDPDEGGEYGDEVVYKEYYPAFIYLVFIANVIAFLYTMAENDWEFADTAENPLYGPTAQVLVDAGAKLAEPIREDGEWWRFIAPVFLHAGVLHLAMNMIVLVRLGASMEVAFGHARVAVIYLASGVAGNLASAIFLPNEIGVGASGALFGLIGALFGDFIHNYRQMEEGKACYFFQLVLSSAIGLAVGLFPLLDNFAHAGGWLCGILTGAVFLAGSYKTASGNTVTYCYTYPVAMVSLVAVAALFFAGFSVFYSDVDPEGWCSWCENVSCVETMWWDCDNALGRNSTAKIFA